MTTYIGIDVSNPLLDIHYNGQATQIANAEKAIHSFLKSLPADTMLTP